MSEHISETTWRLRWADYFNRRAAKSRLNGQNHPEHQKTWFDKALVEDECAIILRMVDRPLSQLISDLDALEEASA